MAAAAAAASAEAARVFLEAGAAVAVDDEDDDAGTSEPFGMGSRAPPKLTLPSSLPPFSTTIEPNETSPLNLPVEQIWREGK